MSLIIKFLFILLTGFILDVSPIYAKNKIINKRHEKMQDKSIKDNKNFIKLARFDFNKKIDNKKESNPKNKKQNKTEKIKKKHTEYLLGPEDVINVLVWKDEDLSKQVTVRPDGKITLPLIDDIQAEGKTTLQIKNEIQTKLKKYIADPNITLSIDSINSPKIYILGEIANPGVFILKSEISILQALAMAGGFREFAATNKMFILRKGLNTSERININYKEILSGDAGQNIIMKRGDVIIVP